MVSKVVFSRKFDEYITPKWMYDILNKQCNFQLDPATTEDNPLGTPIYFTQDENGLEQIWPAVNTFVNSPYSKVGIWVAKAQEQFLINVKKNPRMIIVTLVAARTDTRWFHEIVLESQEEGYCQIQFIQGRIRFENTNNSSTFPSMLIIFKRT